MKLTLLAVLIAVVITAGAAVIYTSTVSDSEISLKAGETANVGGNKITFLESYDSRCPSDVVCFWEGEAVLALSINGNLQNVTVGRSINISGYTISALALEPYPSIKNQSEGPSKATLRIRREKAV
ncbi:hypothetical protein HYU11_03770 [Candidatus Woesearchaeota archaeon]|nr:hypothetical protein [Candidatus Woesearchaeota archaeon]